MTASNAAGAATAESDATGIVAPAPPLNVKPPMIVDALYLGAELGVDEGEWAGTEPFTYSYRWERCRAGSCTEIEGEESHTVDRDDLGSQPRRHRHRDERRRFGDGRFCTEPPGHTATGLRGAARAREAAGGSAPVDSRSRIARSAA